MERRRFVTAVGTASMVALAGCTGGDDDTGSGDGTDSTDEGTDDAETTDEQDGENGDGEETDEDPGPTLDEFVYPAGATREGISGESLYGTHESTLTEAGSLTLDRSRENAHAGREFVTTEANRFEANDIIQEVTDDGETEHIWGPAAEDRSYVRMDSGFEQGYRIDNRSPDTNDVTGLSEMERFLSDVEWSEAIEVVEVGAETYGVRYESVSEPSMFGDRLEEFSATITVVESGYVRVLEHSRIEDHGDLTMDIESRATVSAIGETTVDAPDWAETAREEGIQFSVDLTNDRRALALELLNGGDIPADARIRLGDGQGSEGRQLSQSLTVGDRLYVSLSDEQEVLLDSDGPPADGREFDRSVRLTIRREFVLLSHEQWF